MQRADRIAGGLLGLLVGDALGVPYEFHAASRLPPADELEMEPPAGFARSHRGTPPGTWSDDGAQALCLLASLLEHGRLDLPDFAHRLVSWADRGYLAVDGRVFDIGIQTSRAIGNLRAGMPPTHSGPADERSNGNGSLMRVLPLALWHQGTDAELVADAHAQSLPTHGHARAQVCCALYCLWARGVMGGSESAFTDAISTLERLYVDPVFRADLEEIVAYDGPGGSGYVVDALHSARVAVAAGPYEVAVRRAIAFGDDTDTTACLAGGIAGLRDGVEGIPARWREALRGRELVVPLLEALLATGV